MTLSLADALDEEIYDQGIQLIEYAFPDCVYAAYYNSSEMCRPVIAINKKIETTGARNIAKAHELAHHLSCPTDLLSLSKLGRQKFENLANRRMLERVMSLPMLVRAFESGARSLLDLSEYLEISEEGILRGLRFYKEVYGDSLHLGRHLLTFSPFNVSPFRPLCHV